MSKKQIALVISGAVVVAGAAYLLLRSRPKKQIPKTLSVPVQAPVVKTQAPLQENVEDLEFKSAAGDNGAACRLALLLLKSGGSTDVPQDVARALQLLHHAAENGAVEAMIVVATLMFPPLRRHLGSHCIATNKPGPDSGPEHAIKWWKRALELGSGAAAKLLGDLYLNNKILRLAEADTGFVPNQLVALHGLSSAPLNGALGVVTDPAAQLPDLPERLMIRLVLAPEDVMQKHAKYFTEGLKVKVANLTRLTNAKDSAKAVAYYRKGIELACDGTSGPECMVELAKLFEEGQGIEKNEEEAFKLFNSAADAGFLPAFPRLAMCYFSGSGVKQDYSKCLELASASATLGESKFVLSCMYFEGHGVDKDTDKALQQLRDSAESCSMAMFSLGSLYISGQHVEKDEAAAFLYFKQAADLDLAPAQAHCGHMLLEGQGCEKNEENMRLGIKMLSLAAEQNEPIALMALWQMCMMQGDTDQALQFMKRAASTKHPEALYIYGQMMKNGQGVPLDDAEGERLMAEAVALGFDAEAAAKAAPGQ